MAVELKLTEAQRKLAEAAGAGVVGLFDQLGIRFDPELVQYAQQAHPDALASGVARGTVLAAERSSEPTNSSSEG